MIDDEEFFAWLDGELHGEAAGRVAAAVAASPDLTAKAEQHRRLAADVRGAFDPLLAAAPASPRFETAEIVNFGARAADRERRRSWFSAQHWAAMAASLAIGLVIGTQFIGRADSPIAVYGGRLVAAAALDQALETKLASAPVGEDTRVGLTFRDTNGRICRSFADSSARGLACRESGDWRIRGLFSAAEGQAGDYRMAAGDDPRLAQLIDEIIQGEPFDSAQERMARRNGWR